MPPRGSGTPIRGGAVGGGGVTRGEPGAIIPAEHVATTGVRRTAFGKAGKEVIISINAFPTTVPSEMIYHYDVVISPSEKALPARLNMEIIARLQENEASIFTPKAVYDGRKNLFAIRMLPFGQGLTEKEFDVVLSPGEPKGRAPKVYKVKLVKVAEINPVLLKRFVEGIQSHDNVAVTATTALNVVVRMEPFMRFTFNVRSFFTPSGRQDIGGGLELWRGYFQSVRPASGRMLLNMDIATGVMYKEGPLMNLCFSFLESGNNNPRELVPQLPNSANSRGGNISLSDRDRLRLQRFLFGIRIAVIDVGTGQLGKIKRVIKRLSPVGASSITFTAVKDGQSTQMTVANYFRNVRNKALKYPDVLCVEVGNGSQIPLELCHVLPGQIMRKQVPPKKTRDVLSFSNKKPRERLASIKTGLQVLAHGQSEYVRDFGMNVTEREIEVKARVLPPPTLKFGARSKSLTVVPKDGAWNMVDRQFHTPCTIYCYSIIVYEREDRFTKNDIEGIVKQFLTSCKDLGIRVVQPSPSVSWQNSHQNILPHLENAGRAAVQMGKKINPEINAPSLIICILPENAVDTYTTIKHWGDCHRGVPTQCMKSIKCKGQSPQYFANICLKINAKLGGVNLIPDPASVSALTDPNHPTIVMGADVIHPALGSEGKPSFTALVGSTTAGNSKYIAVSRVQTSRQEMISDLQAMSKEILSQWRYKAEAQPLNPPPKRIIFYRDGVSEGEFAQVLSVELPALQRACKELKIEPKITVIVVGKRHHIRFFPQERDADRSGNCKAGTVVDREVAHPTDLDFYLQSHGGLLGTSRPAHYSVLHDESNFTPDALQSLSFALCHVYARVSRSVSIPAPVYYADIVCSRAKTHYAPNSGTGDLSETGTSMSATQAEDSLERYRSSFKPIHINQRSKMYFT